MEGVSIYEHRGALEQVARKFGIRCMSTDGWGASGNAERPAVLIGALDGKDDEEIENMFEEELDRVVGERCLFNVRVLPEYRVRSYSCPFYMDGKWLDNVN